MKKLFLTAIFTMALFAGNASAQIDECFENMALQHKQFVSWVVLDDGTLDGSFETVGYDNNSSGEMFAFTGTRRGKDFRIKFTGSVPYEAPKGKPIVWTIVGKTLRVPMYGKNHNTGKFSNYTVTFSKCKQ